MNKVMSLILVACLASWVGADAPTKTSQPKPVPVKAGKVMLAPANSRIDFVGEHEGPKPDPRNGGFTKFSGKATVDEGGELTSVSFEFDTASMWTEIPKLTTHLKSPDFFDVRQHPKASFESTSIAPSKKKGTFDVTGKFTLLGKTQEIKLPATVIVASDGLTLISKFTVDRTKFGMTYGEGKVKNDVAISVVVGEPTMAGKKKPATAGA